MQDLFISCRPLLAAVVIAGLSTACAAPSSTSQTPSSATYTEISLADFYDAIKHWNDRTGETGAAHYAPSAITQIADNLLVYQRDDGSWPTNKHPTRIMSAAERAQLLREKSLRDGSFDNRNVYPQIEYLLNVYAQTQRAQYRDAALKGLAYTLDKQYANGGVAHSPDRTDFAYYRHITFADEIMPGVLRFLRKVAAGAGVYKAVPLRERERALLAVARGDALILQLQIQQNGQRTAWAGQYDAVTLAPATGRSFELPGILAWESVPVVEYLMSIPQPSADIISAVDAAMAWFERAQLRGIRLEKVAVTAQRFDQNGIWACAQGEYGRCECRPISADADTPGFSGVTAGS